MKAVIFDLDGTLIDSAPDIHAAANAVLQGEGLPLVTSAQSQLVGVRAVFRRADGHCRDGRHEPARTTLHKRFLHFTNAALEGITRMVTRRGGCGGGLGAPWFGPGLAQHLWAANPRGVLGDLGLGEACLPWLSAATACPWPQARPRPL